MEVKGEHKPSPSQCLKYKIISSSCQIHNMKVCDVCTLIVHSLMHSLVSVYSRLHNRWEFQTYRQCPPSPGEGAEGLLSHCPFYAPVCHWLSCSVLLGDRGHGLLWTRLEPVQGYEYLTGGSQTLALPESGQTQSTSHLGQCGHVQRGRLRSEPGPWLTQCYKVKRWQMKNCNDKNLRSLAGLAMLLFKCNRLQTMSYPVKSVRSNATILLVQLVTFDYFRFLFD